MRFTRELRQKIVSEFAVKNGGWFDPALFLASVREVGQEHPAWEWFQWDDERAALEYRLDQARDFARGLVVRFEVEEVHRGKMRITERSAPLILSPMGKRKDGGGYFVTDPSSAEHMDELRKQAAQSLRWFISRYEAVLSHVGVGLAPLERVRALLDDQTEHKEAA